MFSLYFPRFYVTLALPKVLRLGKKKETFFFVLRSTFRTFAGMTKEDIKKIVDDERAEQLTVQLCRHWEVATERLAELVQDMEANIDTCIEAEVYAAVMRMQSAVMALMKLNEMPTTFLFSEYLDRIGKTVTNVSIRQSVMTLAQRLLSGVPSKQKGSFFELMNQMLAQHFALSKEQQKDINQTVSSTEYILTVCAPYLNPEDLMMMVSIIQDMNTEGDNPEEVIGRVKDMRQVMENLATKMSESLQMMLIWLVLLMMLPELLVKKMQQNQTDSKLMAQLFDKVLVRVRESGLWWDYWKEWRETLRVVSDSSSLKEIMKAERSKVREELGKVPGGLFAKWTTDRKAFDADFLDVPLSDDDLRSFIFHLATLAEIARELDPTTKFGEEQLVRNEAQQVGDAVLEAASKLQDLLADAWFPHYEPMWQELIQNETIFAHLKVTRQSPHNNLFTARFFCHLVGEMKKSAVFGGHSDNDLAEKLTEPRYVGTFRKNIQEGMGDESESLQNIFDTIYQKYNALAHPKK